MTHPGNPPPYDTIYPQGQPVQVHPVPIHQVAIHQVPTDTVIIQQQPQPRYGGQNVMGGRNMGFESVLIVCQACNYTVTTRTEIQPGLRTHMCAACLCIIGLWPCCVVPYCLPSCNNIDHYCPKCNAYIGSYKG